jgi:hypothetical protein
VLALRAASASAQEAYEPPARLEERTAYTVGAGDVKLGLIAFEVGITDQVSIGTDPPAWAARAVIPLFVPNLHVKVKFYEQGQLAIAARAGGYYASLSGDEGTSGSLVSVPLSLYASIPLAPRWLLHPEATYSFARAFGTGDLDNADANGAVSTRAGILGTLLQFKVTRVMSLTALGRYQVYSGSLVFEGEDNLDEFTTVDVEATLEPQDPHPWQVIGGVAFVWERVQLAVGLGYGFYFVPGMDIPIAGVGLVPDFSLAVTL